MNERSAEWLAKVIGFVVFDCRRDEKDSSNNVRLQDTVRRINGYNFRLTACAVL